MGKDSDGFSWQTIFSGITLIVVIASSGFTYVAMEAKLGQQVNNNTEQINKNGKSIEANRKLIRDVMQSSQELNKELRKTVQNNYARKAMMQEIKSQLERVKNGIDYLIRKENGKSTTQWQQNRQ